MEKREYTEEELREKEESSRMDTKSSRNMFPRLRKERMHPRSLQMERDLAPTR